MSSFDWTASGIKNTFTFECVDIKKLDNHICWLDGVTGGKITQTYRGDYRISASLDIDGTEIPKHCAIRIWHTATLDGNSETEELATLIPQSTSNTLERGRITGSIDLYSPMKFLDSDLVTKNSPIIKGTVAHSKFAAICRNSGHVALIDSGMQSKNAALASTWVWEHGKSALTALQQLADTASGYIIVDSHGRVALQPYVNPSNAATAGDISTGINSLILLGVDISTGDICNKVIASYETGSDEDKKTYTAQAVLAATHPWSFQSLGYWATQEASSPTFSDDDTATTIQKKLQQTVNTELASAASYNRTFSIDMLYTPHVRVGAAYNLFYQDAPDGEVISSNVFISQREITLDAAMKCALTCEERWTNDIVESEE